MSTITNREIIQKMLDNDGTYPGDPQAESIWEYKHTITGKTMWAVFWPGSFNDLHLSPYVREHRMLWCHSAGHINPIGITERRKHGTTNGE